jgi:hypothetical protein
MNKKLTLSLNAAIIDFAHEFSKKTKKPISKIIEDYFSQLRNKDTDKKKLALPKSLADLYGIFEGIEVPDKKTLRKMYHERHNS